MRRIILLICCWLICSLTVCAQVRESMYGDAVKVDVKMKYVYSFEEALKKAKEEHKPIFFNCFADWAVPCHAMNKVVFSDQEFADWMDKHFVNFFMDVTTPEGRPLGEKYNVRFQAHYLVLDEEGNIVHRIVGGYQIPEFKEKLSLALSPRTSLAGLNKRYESGDRNMKFLRDYAMVLRSADEKDLYDKVADEYMAGIKKSDWPKKENWVIFSDKLTEPKGELFDYLLAHRDEFAKNNGEEIINGKFSRLYFVPLYYMATGEKYDGNQLLNIYMTLEKAKMPKDQSIYIIYNIAKYRGEKKFDEMMKVFEKDVPALDERTASGLDMSLKDWNDMTATEKNRIVAYWTSKAEKSTGSLQNNYQEMIKNMVNPEGILFADLNFEDALKKAKAENKLIFIDCYTSWCGPCKMMSKQVFTQKAIGDFFNERFVNLKVDMEKGEGVDLQKRYSVNAFPTMMLLDGDGRIVYKILGGQDPRVFMEKIQRGLLPAACYYQLKEKYDAGDRSIALMPEYFLTMGDAGELKNQAEEIRNYLKTLKNTDLFDKSTWKLYDYFVTNFKMPEFQFLCENRKLFAGPVEEGEVNHKIEAIIFPAVIGYLKKENPKEDMEIIRKLISKASLPENFSVSYLDQIVNMYDKKEFGKMLDFYENEVADMSDAKAKLNLDVLLKSLLQDAPISEKKRAVGYVQKCLKNANTRAVNTYNGLLEILSKQG